MKTKKLTINRLEYKINLLRKRMISSAFLKGFTHPHTISCSQELDVYLNKYYQINSFKSKTND